MSHKVNPKVFRIGTTQQWDSIWFDEKNYKKTLEEDLKIRDFITSAFGKGVIERTRIERKGDKVSISLSSPRPGLVVGRSGGDFATSCGVAEGNFTEISGAGHLRNG